MNVPVVTEENNSGHSKLSKKACFSLFITGAAKPVQRMVNLCLPCGTCHLLSVLNRLDRFCTRIVSYDSL